MNFVRTIDEEEGYCPKCSSGDTVTLRGKAKRVCLDCEFSEEFECYDAFLGAWQKRLKTEIVRSAPLATWPVDPEISLHRPTQHQKRVEKFIEIIEPEITKVTIPTQYRDDFSNFLTSRNIRLCRSAKTDVWNGIESAYTDFVLRVRSSTARMVIEAWLPDDDLLVQA